MGMFDLVVKGGTVYTASETYQADIGVKGERVTAIGKDLPVDGAEVVNAKGRQVLPGGIDVHVHLELPFSGTVSSDDFESGTRAAACGGVTTVVDFAPLDKEKGLVASIEARKAAADPKVCVDYALHQMLTKWDDKIRKELKKAVDLGVVSFKMFMIYEREGWMADDSMLFSALEESRDLGCVIMVHAESERVMNYLTQRYLAQKEKVGAYGHVLSRPNFIEEEAILRACKWAEATGGYLYVVHMSTGEGADAIKAAQARRVNVNVETCPQYLLLSDEVFKDKKTGHYFATCPQIKKKADNERLWRGLADGEVKVVSTDTCTFTTKQKAMWNGDFTRIPFGLPGVETLMPSVYTHGYKAGRFSLNHFVSLLSTQPARLFGLYPRKGTIAVGSDADFSIIDPKHGRTIDYKDLATNCDWSPFQGMKMHGFPETTISRGTVVVKDYACIAKKGRGKFIKRVVPTQDPLWQIRPAENPVAS